MIKHQRIHESRLIEPDHIATVGKTPDDTDFNQQWGAEQNPRRASVEATYSDSSIKIAILDSGIDSSHPDLSSR
jgi:thermitase